MVTLNISNNALVVVPQLVQILLQNIEMQKSYDQKRLLQQQNSSNICAIFEFPALILLL